jgi:hypothetical protein
MCKIDEESVTTTAHPTPAADFDPSVKRKNPFSDGPHSKYYFAFLYSFSTVCNVKSYTNALLSDLHFDPHKIAGDKIETSICVQ